MTVQVIRAGLITTVQDLGRRGYQQYGVSVGGAMDRFATRVANILVGNPESAAVLEATLRGPTLRFDSDALIAICGCDLAPTIDGAPVPRWRPVAVRKDTTIAFGTARSGCRAYLAIAGGFDVPLVLNSRCTYLRATLGGHEGRALQAGDALPVGAPSVVALEIMHQLSGDRSKAFNPARWNAEPYAPAYAEHPTARIILGCEFDWLSQESQQLLLNTAYEITNQSDRMGYRLSRPTLTLAQTRKMMVSAPVCAGTIQVPPDGQPLVLMADCATTGGYPRVAHVATVDLPLVAQAKPGSRLRFQKITLGEAHELYRAAETAIEKLKLALKLKGAHGP